MKRVSLTQWSSARRISRSVALLYFAALLWGLVVVAGCAAPQRPDDLGTQTQDRLEDFNGTLGLYAKNL